MSLLGYCILKACIIVGSNKHSLSSSPRHVKLPTTTGIIIFIHILPAKCPTNSACCNDALLYCAPAWSGYCTAANRDRLESFLRRCKRLGYCDVDTQSVMAQFQLADETLFERVLNDDRHVLHSLLPPRTEYSYNLRRRRHDYELIAKTRT